MSTTAHEYYRQLKVVLDLAAQSLPRDEYIDFLEEVEDEADSRAQARLTDKT